MKDQNKDIDPQFWIKHPYFDKSAAMLSPPELDQYLIHHNLQQYSAKICPWFTTAQPINKFKRKFWSITDDNGTVYVSRSRSCTKPFYFREPGLSKDDQCRICSKYLISEYHQFMFIFPYSPNPTKSTLWDWQESKLKACYMHFHSSKAFFVDGRNPNKWTEDDGKEDEPTYQADIEIPDEY